MHQNAFFAQDDVQNFSDSVRWRVKVGL